MHVWSNIILITKVSNRTVIIIVGDFYIREYYKPGQSKFFAGNPCNRDAHLNQIDLIWLQL